MVISIILSSVRAKGLMFGDYYHFTSADNKTVEYQHGFWIRRIYLTFDAEISNGISSRVTLEMNTPYGFGKSLQLVPFVKNAYLKYKPYRFLGILVGIIPSPTFDIVEQKWGKRYLEKTPEDLYKLGPASEFGLGLKGDFSWLKYYIVYGNGSGNESEGDRNKKIMGSLAAEKNGFLIEIYGDWWDIDASSDKKTAHIFVSHEIGPISSGLLYSHQKIQGGLVNPNIWEDLRVASLYFGVKFGKVGAVLRYDRGFDKNPAVLRQSYVYFPSDTSFHFVLAGIEYNPTEKVYISPNVEVVKSDNPSFRPTVISRITLFFEF